MNHIILYGAGTTGRVIARSLIAKEIPFVFVDSNPAKHMQIMEGAEVIAPSTAKLLYPDATWLATSIIPEFHEQIVKEIQKLGVKTVPVWGYLPQRNTPPPPNVAVELRRLVVHDALSYRMVNDQIALRLDPEHYRQEEPDDIKNIYFPDFITHLDLEHYVDCGAADGDTVREFLKRWEKYAHISAIEPDAKNFHKLRVECQGRPDTEIFHMAVTDHGGRSSFVSTGDYSAHLGEGDSETKCWRLDYLPHNGPPPTYIKMDIEGSELEALWGARRILHDHSPVLAICAYHEAEHFWQIPLLIHALQPAYKLFFRRYAQGSFELVWYAVPADRVKQ